LDGAPMGELHGHEAYIYSIAILPNGDIVSSGEDRTVRVFRDGQCIQTITHPAISIWSVAACQETGDIVSGASDKTIRVFSRDPERHADAEVRGSDYVGPSKRPLLRPSLQTLNSFEESIRMYAIPAETASQNMPFEKENLPGPGK
jgi:phospholipase A-2-activating protein